MTPTAKFTKKPSEFWAYVKVVGEAVGYSKRGASKVSVPTEEDLKKTINEYGLDASDIFSAKGALTALGQDLVDYFVFRAKVLNEFVEPRLMDAKRAEEQFNKLKSKLNPKCPLPMNKQTGEKKKNAYLTCIVNMLIEQNCGDLECNYDPRGLTQFYDKNKLVYALSRRVDGSFPKGANPCAIWEIKEYYYTTTFGSRVADGVYESLLDGFELESIRQKYGIVCEHYVMVDAHYTWWECGKSYLCRLIDMLHMGYCDGILFGYEVLEEFPAVVRAWAKRAKG